MIQCQKISEHSARVLQGTLHTTPQFAYILRAIFGETKTERKQLHTDRMERTVAEGGERVSEGGREGHEEGGEGVRVRKGGRGGNK